VGREVLRVLTEIKNRGVRDVLMLVCDGLKRLPDAVNTVWDKTIVQTCVVHYSDAAIMPMPAPGSVRTARSGLALSAQSWGVTLALCMPETSSAQFRLLVRIRAGCLQADRVVGPGAGLSHPRR
jgi:hypothetical protein